MRPTSLGAAAALAFCLAFAPGAALAVRPDEVLSDPAMEARARHLSSELRCLVCQNESIDDSDADLARDIRLLVRGKMKDGASDAAIRAFLVQRYGAFVLLKPPLEWGTILLWGMPSLVLILGAAGLAAARRRQALDQTVAPLSDVERHALDRLLAD